MIWQRHKRCWPRPKISRGSHRPILVVFSPGAVDDAIIPCTALAAFDLAREAVPDLRGQEVVVIGASTIVGKPLAQLFLAAEATVRTCHIATRDTAAHAREADIVAVAVGVPGLVQARLAETGGGTDRCWYQPHCRHDGKRRVVGDADPAAYAVASAYTPVPGGVGAVTTTVLLENVATAAQRQAAAPRALADDAVLRLLGPAAADMSPELIQQVGQLLATHLPTGTGLTGLPRALRQSTRR